MGTNQAQASVVDSISAVIASYFYALHHADCAQLRAIFHPEARLQAPDVRRDLNTWLDLVASRAVPAAQQAEFLYRILAIDVVGAQAMVKVLCPLLGHSYVDFLGLLYEQGQWRIVNKMYAEQAV